VILKPKHISTYELTVEQGTLLDEYIKTNKMKRLEEEKIIEMYDYTIDYLKAEGFVHYEISNFAMPDYFCRHNLNYWERGEYYGVGLGAHSFVKGRRFYNTDNPGAYMEALSGNRSPVKETEVVTDDKALSEAIFLGLRKTEGINLKDLSETYGKDIFKLYQKEIKELQGAGLIWLSGSSGLNCSSSPNCSNRHQDTDTYMKLTRKGLLLSNEVFARFM